MTHPTPIDPEAVLHFWFDELGAAQHFAKDAALDATIARRFGPVLEAAARGELSGWRATCALRCSTRPSSSALAATRTAMPCWGVRPRRRSWHS